MGHAQHALASGLSADPRPSCDAVAGSAWAKPSTHRPADSKYSAIASRPCAALSTPLPAAGPEKESAEAGEAPEPLRAPSAAQSGARRKVLPGASRADSSGVQPTSSAPPLASVPAGPPGAAPAAARRSAALPPASPPACTSSEGPASCGVVRGRRSPAGGSWSASAMASAYRTKSRRWPGRPCASSSAASGSAPNAS